jgi:hypothetical protein
MSGVPDQKNGCGHAMAENDMYEPPCRRQQTGPLRSSCKDCCHRETIRVRNKAGNIGFNGLNRVEEDAELMQFEFFGLSDLLGY